MKIAFVTMNYPTPARPGHGTFVQQFVWGMAREGHECTVINPVSFFDKKFGSLPDRHALEEVPGGGQVRVHRPRYISFSSRKVGPFHTARLTQWALKLRVWLECVVHKVRVDLVYGHFLYHAGAVAALVARRQGVPSVIGVGEGTFWTVEPHGFDKATRELSDVTGFIAVGTHIKSALISQLQVPESKILVAPNGIDPAVFYPGDRAQARAALHLPQYRFIVGFVGTFNHLKGGSELLEAVKDLPELGVVMIGDGPLKLDGPNVLFKGGVPHADIRQWLQSCDVFVLPTREEGSCNAVIEAMACGLPVITSSGDYMDDLVDPACAIRTDPRDVDAIRQAIVRLANDPQLRANMAQAAQNKSRAFHIARRTRAITDWMNRICLSEPAGARDSLPG